MLSRQVDIKESKKKREKICISFELELRIDINQQCTIQKNVEEHSL